ncbi:MAG: hypothetical protein KME54_26810 [Tolypothrix brevis GSE-NOS-MK-07-07A]|jgi:hypothetical protein|nr:hypothetical protein [Tolypothrix brevis GSE-NOS-MK-07-07A]
MPISKSETIKTIADITGLQGALDVKSPTSHTHAIALIEGLQAALDAKALASHTHDPESWQDLSISAGWSIYATGYATVQCRKHVGGLIEVKGVIKKSSALTTNELICTLPVGYRPSKIMMLLTWANNGSSRLIVETGGAVRLSSGSAGGLGLNFFFSN